MKNIFFYEAQIGKITIADNGTDITNMNFGEIHLDNSNIIETELI